MQNSVWVGMLSFATLSLVAFVQDEGADATANKTLTIQSAPASSGADAASDGDIAGTAETALESIADGVDDAPPEAPDLTSEETSSPATADDTYTPTERISEDRSVSFPVDI